MCPRSLEVNVTGSEVVGGEDRVFDGRGGHRTRFRSSWWPSDATTRSERARVRVSKVVEVAKHEIEGRRSNRRYFLMEGEEVGSMFSLGTGTGSKQGEETA